MSKLKKLLWVEDDLFYIRPYIEALEEKGYEVLTAKSITEAQNLMTQNRIRIVITDIMIPSKDEPEQVETKGGYETGIVLARWIRKNYPHTPILGLTVNTDFEIRQRFMRYGSAFESKFTLREIREFVEYVTRMLKEKTKQTQLKAFIVHGRDEVAKYELKNYLQNNLRIGEPIILHERPSLGRTILEKFEDEASDVDVVFVLLTPDDAVYNSSTPDDIKRRARQNVIFELGYFIAKLERKRGRVLLLYKGELELPSDIHGLAYIDVTASIESAGEKIRKELSGIL